MRRRIMRRRIMKQLLLSGKRLLLSSFIASTTLALAGQPVFATDLTIYIRSEKETKGIAFISMEPEDEADKFPGGGKAFFNSTIALTVDGKAALIVKDVPPGKYALSGFLDINGNGKLDKNILGAPTEPYGFSNDARGLFGPPSFSDAVFVVTDDQADIKQTIKLH